MSLSRRFRGRLKDEWNDQTPVDPQDFVDRPIGFGYLVSENDRWMVFDDFDDLAVCYTTERAEIDLHMTDLISGQSKTIRVEQPFRKELLKAPDASQLSLADERDAE